MPTKKPKPDLVKAADNFSRKYEDVFGDKDPQDIINELRGDGDVSGASMNSSGESAAREQWRHKENSMTTKPEIGGLRDDYDRSPLLAEELASCSCSMECCCRRCGGHVCEHKKGKCKYHCDKTSCIKASAHDH